MNIIKAALIGACALSTTTYAETTAPRLDQDFKITVPFRAGGGLDARARIVAKHLSAKHNINISVENIPGSGGSIGTTLFLTGRKTGPYDMMFAPASVFTSTKLFTKTPYTQDDIYPVAAIDKEQFGLFANPERTGINTMDDLMKYSKENRMLYGTGGPASIPFLLQTAFFNDVEVKASSLPHNSGMEGLTNLLGGHNSVTMAGLALAEDYVKSGKIVPLMTFNSTDNNDYFKTTVPSVNKFISEGNDLAYSGLMFFLMRDDAKDQNKQAIAAAFKEILNDEALKADLATTGVLAIPQMTSKDIAAHLSKELNQLETLKEQVVK